MIFYFSGTGNSLHAVRIIAAAQGEQLVSIAKEFNKGNAIFEYTLKEHELLGFVYPVYAWAPPKMVLDFISRLKVIGDKPYVFSLSTCGDEEGHTTSRLNKSLSRKSLLLNSAFSIQMPNNYIIGYDVDSKEIEQKKLQSEEQKLKEINDVLKKRQSGIFHIIPGESPALKTAIVNPLFNQFAINTKKFYANDACTHCGLCEKICTVHTITIKEKPVWGKVLYAMSCMYQSLPSGSNSVWKRNTS